MEPSEVETLIEDGIGGAEATVTRTREDHDDDHLAATVVAPAFEGVALVQRHEMVYDALGEHMTTDIHALEIRAQTPEEATEGDASGDD